jgi:hypothetical protein
MGLDHHKRTDGYRSRSKDSDYVAFIKRVVGEMIAALPKT